MAEIGKDILLAADLLSQGKLVAIPTETVYGLAANALNEDAVLSIFKAKKRPFFDPLIVHIPDLKALALYVAEVPPLAKKLAEALWPGPLTLLLPKKEIISDLLTAGSPLVGIRIPDHTITRQLLGMLEFPLAAPSANPFGYISPTEALHVNAQLGNEVQYILDGGPCKIGLESTIVGFDAGKPIIMRLGGISVQQVEEIIGAVTLQLNQSSNPSVPGQLKSHYSPAKPFFIGEINNLLKINKPGKAGLISFQQAYSGKNIHKNFILSTSGSLDEAARNLFKVMREADQSDLDYILAERVPNTGLGMAINDRMERAAAKS